jgi:hypothetical protein
MKMEAIDPPETLAAIYNASRHRIPEKHNIFTAFTNTNLVNIILINKPTPCSRSSVKLTALSVKAFTRARKLKLNYTKKLKELKF